MLSERELSRRVPCTVRCRKTGNAEKLEKREGGLFLCPKCKEPWTLNQLDNWADTVEAVVTVMADHLDFTKGAREAFDAFLNRCIEGRRETWELAMGDRDGHMDLATAMEVADSLLQEGCSPYETQAVTKGVIRTLRDAVAEGQTLGNVEGVGSQFAEALVMAEDIIDMQPEARGDSREKRQDMMRRTIQGLYSGSRLLVARLEELQGKKGGGA
jgi:hypothetical protein